MTPYPVRYHAPPDLIIALAVDTASRGPCAKSKRGVVIYGPHPDFETPMIFGNAWNAQPWPFECDKSDACKAACGQLCVHAEQRAIFQMLLPPMDELHRFVRDKRVRYPDPGSLSLVHVKTKDGKLVPSPKGPSCAECSKLVLENKWIGTVWLYEVEGHWSQYTSTHFHRTTLVNLGLPITL